MSELGSSKLSLIRENLMNLVFSIRKELLQRARIRSHYRFQMKFLGMVASASALQLISTYNPPSFQSEQNTRGKGRDCESFRSQ